MATIYCTKCGNQMDAKAKFCSKCGSPVEPVVTAEASSATITCYECGQDIPADAESCPNCGAPMSKRITCYECGQSIPADAKSCPNCGAPMKKGNVVPAPAPAEKPVANVAPAPQVTAPAPEPVHEEDSAPAPDPEPAPAPEPEPKAEAKKAPAWLVWAIIGGLLVVAGIVAGIFYHDNIYLPKKRDAEAARYYVMSNTVRMRSTPDFEADYNKVETFSYGTELLVYDSNKTATTPYFLCKFAPVDAKGKVMKDKCVEGYVASDYLMPKADFFLLNSIFGNDDAREMLAEARYKKALLTYFKNKKYRGNIDAKHIQEYGINPKLANAPRWQVFCRNTKAKSNTVYRSKKYRKDSKYPDAAIIIQNIDSRERCLLYFVFDDDETAHLILEQKVKDSGYMKDRTLQLKQNSDGGYSVKVEFED